MVQEVITAVVLLEKLNTELRNAGIDKAACEFTSVQRHQPDADGCNWGATFTRHDTTAKVPEGEVGAIMLAASKKFNISDSG